MILIRELLTNKTYEVELPFINLELSQGAIEGFNIPMTSISNVDETEGVLTIPKSAIANIHQKNYFSLFKTEEGSFKGTIFQNGKELTNTEEFESLSGIVAHYQCIIKDKIEINCIYGLSLEKEKQKEIQILFAEKFPDEKIIFLDC